MSHYLWSRKTVKKYCEGSSEVDVFITRSDWVFEVLLVKRYHFLLVKVSALTPFFRRFFTRSAKSVFTRSLLVKVDTDLDRLLDQIGLWLETTRFG